MSRGGARSAREGAVLLALAAFAVVSFRILGDARFHGWALGLGSTLAPTWHHAVFLVFFTLFGAATVALVALGLARLLPAGAEPAAVPDRLFMATATALGLLVPLALRLLVLHGSRITDDESLYRFAATLLAHGRLTAPSHPMRLFFDHAGVVNDGRMYTQYFLGWPAFLSVGVLLGVPWLVNPLLSALTVPALYLLTRRLTNRLWAQVVVVLFLTSPMLQMLAATELAHTSDLFALTWTAWLAFEAADRPRSGGPAALLALAFSAAFFVRPLTALGIGLPLLGLWGVAWWRERRPLVPAVAFAAPAVGMAALFLGVNVAQTGSAWTPAYVAWHAYAVGNGYRFSGIDPATALAVPNLAFTGLGSMVGRLFIGLVRFNFSLLGWPSAFLLLPLAIGVRRSGVLWASLVLFLVVCLPLHDPGIDTVGPVHLAGLALPVLVLTGVGLFRWTASRAAKGEGSGLRRSIALVAALVVCDLALYAPVRLGGAAEVARLASFPERTLRAHGVSDAVVFSTVPYARACDPRTPVPSVPFVRWWPLDSPGFDGSIVYANHLSVARDRALVHTYFPGRTGWILHWTRGCRLDLVPLASKEATELPDGIMIFGSRGIVPYDGADPSGARPRGGAR